MECVGESDLPEDTDPIRILVRLVDRLSRGTAATLSCLPALVAPREIRGRSSAQTGPPFKSFPDRRPSTELSGVASVSPRRDRVDHPEETHADPARAGPLARAGHHRHRRHCSLAITREDQRKVRVTVYDGSLGLVEACARPACQPDRPRRSSSTSPLRSIRHRPLKSLTDPAGLRILEQNYEYDLLSSEKLLEKYVGRKIQSYAERRDLPRGDPPAGTNGPVFEIDGQIHLGLHGRVVLPALPENLVSKPTLTWLLRNEGRAPAADRGVLSDGGYRVEGGLHDRRQRRRQPERSHGLGHHRQQERRHLRQRDAEARGR